MMSIRGYGAGVGGAPACRRLLLGTVAVLGCFAIGPDPALATQADAPAPDTHLLAQAAAEKSFAITPQPLGAALRLFREQSGMQLAYRTEDVQGIATAGVQGSHTPEAALRLLLAGTGISYSLTAADTATLVKVGSGDAGGAVLDPVTAVGQAESATGPVDGYIATRSATGTKTDTPLIETPQSISVVTSDQIEAQGAQTINEALRYTPGVVTETRGVATRYDGVMIRGFGSYIGTDQSTYLDGLRLLRNDWYSYASVDPYTLERVELFRGPASVLYGQGSPGGLTGLVSKRPPDQPFHEVVLEAGTHDRYQGAFDLGGPVDDSESVLFRVIGLARDADSQIDFVEERRFLLAPSLTWRPTEDTELTLLGSYQQDPESGFFGWVPAQGSIFDNPNGSIPSSFFDGDPSFEKFERTQTMAGYALDHRIDDSWTLRQNFRYTHLDLDYLQVYGLGLQGDLRTLNRGTALTMEDTNTFAVDNQAESRFATGPLEHTALAGLDFYRMTSDVQAGFGAAPTLDVFAPDYDQVITAPPITFDQDDRIHQLGVYVQDQVQFDRFTLSLGGRHDWAESRTRNLIGGGAASDIDDTAFTGRAGLVYLFDVGLAPYASYSESFLPVAGTTFSGTPFEPETGRQYEIGLKYQPPGGEGFFAVSVFDLARQNVTTGDPDNVGFRIQTGEITSRGIELEAKAELIDGLSLIAAYTYLDAEITKDNDGNEGNRPHTVPTHMASLWGDYKVGLGDFAGLGLGAGVRYVGESYGDSANSFTVPDFLVVDAAISYDLGALDYRLDGVELQLNARNLLDEKYVSACDGSSAFCYYGARRTVLATFKYRW